jgi:hypothetical protein
VLRNNFLNRVIKKLIALFNSTLSLFKTKKGDSIIALFGFYLVIAKGDSNFILCALFFVL